MEKNEFKNKLKQSANELNLNINEAQLETFFKYKKLLLQWNEKCNLTAITTDEEIIKKHFIDSLTFLEYINKEDKIIDIGTGAGFPGIPIKIMKSDIQLTLLDSLNKRVEFLNYIIKENEIYNCIAIHGRAEDIARNSKHREIYDIATSRAVAKLNVLLEYMLPFLKQYGKCIIMKGPNIKEEIEQSSKALKELRRKDS